MGCVEQACDILAAAGPHDYLDLADLVQRLALDVIGKIGFAVDFGATRGFIWQAADPQAAAAEGLAASAGKDSSTDDEAVTADNVFEMVHGTLGELAKRWISPWRTALRHITAVSSVLMLSHTSYSPQHCIPKDRPYMNLRHI